MMLSAIFEAMKLNSYYVAEIINGKEIRVTTDFQFLADAETAMQRMPEGNYVIKTA